MSHITKKYNGPLHMKFTEFIGKIYFKNLVFLQLRNYIHFIQG